MKSDQIDLHSGGLSLSILEAIQAKGEVEALRLLKRAEPDDINIKDSEGLSFLDHAAIAGMRLLCTALLWDADFEHHESTSASNFTSLHWAASCGQAGVCHALLEHPRFLDIATLDACGRTALHVAAQHGHAECCRVLLEHPRFVASRPPRKDAFGDTALHRAAAFGHVDVCEVLLKHPAFGKLSSRDVQGRSPLERAIREGRLQTSRFLKQKLRIAHRLDIDDHGIVLQQAPDNSLEHDAGLPSRDLEKVELPLVDNARASSTVAAIKGGERPDILDYDGLPEVQAPGYVEVAERPSTYTDNLALPSKVQTFGFGEAELPAGVDDTHRRSIAATATKGSERPTTSGDKEDGFPMLSEVEGSERPAILESPVSGYMEDGLALPSEVQAAELGEVKLPCPMNDAHRSRTDVAIQAELPSPADARRSSAAAIQVAGDHVAEHAGIWGYKDDGLARLPKVESPGHGEVGIRPQVDEARRNSVAAPKVGQSSQMVRLSSAHVKAEWPSEYKDHGCVPSEVLSRQRLTNRGEEADADWMARRTTAEKQQVKLLPSSQHFLSEGRTPLHRAAKQGRLEVILALLEGHGLVNVNAKDIHGCTCLHYAAKEGHLQVCAALLKHPPLDVVAVDMLGCNALHCAAAGGHGETCKLILKHSAEIAMHGTFQVIVQYVTDEVLWPS
ncbi:unnamed protein product [Durusdinium trenchii]|uniref:Uncharacterized protein n=1 Tax=Durusdinium trenchii TaxID=1381693 RepID=A0ABP0PTN9_9DINO